jgi:hypothetical protein
MTIQPRWNPQDRPPLTPRAAFARELHPASADRIVVDRNRITGGGVTAGIDFAFQLAAELRERFRAGLGLPSDG